MMQLEHEYDDVLRRVLHAAADLVEPSADGLERIRARLTTPQPAVIAWLLAGYSDLIRPALGWAQPVLGWLRPVLDRMQPVLDRLRVALGPVIERFKPARPDAAHPQRRYAWLRPAAAMGTAVFVVAMGAFALTALPQVISSSNVFVLPFTGGGSGGHAGAGGVNGYGAPLPPSQVFASGASPGTQSPRTQVAPTCSTAPSPAPSGATASPSPSTAPPPASPSPTTPAPTSPSPSESPTPSPSVSNSDPAPPPSPPASAEGSVIPVPAASPTVTATLDAAPSPSSSAAAPCGPAPTKAPPAKGTRATRGNAQAKLG